MSNLTAPLGLVSGVSRLPRHPVSAKGRTSRTGLVFLGMLLLACTPPSPGATPAPPTTVAPTAPVGKPTPTDRPAPPKDTRPLPSPVASPAPR